MGLAAPGGVLTTAIAGTLFTFANTPPDPTYTLLGFEVYYKLYDNTSPGQTALQSYFNDTSQFTAATYATPGIAALLSEGYQRLAAFPSTTGYPVSTAGTATWVALSASQASTLQQPPMIPISSGDRPNSFFVHIDFSQNRLTTTPNLPAVTAAYQSGPTIVFANGSTTLYAGRLVIPTSGSTLPSGTYYLKSFGAQSFDKYDPDLPSTIASQPSGTTIPSLGVGIVVLAYGLDPNVLTVYSIPVPIGYVLLTNIALQQ